MTTLTTYQEVWDIFKAIGRVNAIDLPVSDDGRYKLINAARMEYNNYLETCLEEHIKLKQDDETETFSDNLPDNKKELIAECIKLVTVRNMYLQFVSDMQVFQSSIGVRDYRSQCSARENIIKMQETRIDEILNKIADAFEG